MITAVTENQLDAWVRGNAQLAQKVVVELVWRLVAASCPNPRERRFPLGDSIGQHGPDGILDVDLGFGLFVPEGQTLWEIGCSGRAGAKATQDYKELTENVPAEVRADAAFVFVTPLSGRKDWEFTWKGDAQADWLKKRRKSNEWKEIRIIDGTRLIDWVHQFPAVELWLAEIIGGVRAQQIEIPEQRWGVLKSVGEPPPLIPGLFLGNRDQACNKLKEVFDGTSAQLKLVTHFPDQAIDFVCAYLASLDDESRIGIAGRCLIVNENAAWNVVCGQRPGLILIADPALDLNGESGTRIIQKARNGGHAVVFSGPHGGPPDPASIPLPMPSSSQIRVGLGEAGYAEQRARTLAAESGGNLGSLLRCIQNISLLPEWAEHSAAAELAIAELLGSWSEGSDADLAVAESLSGKEYGEWIGTMREIVLRPGTPLTQRNGNWKFLLRFEGWYGLGPKLFDDHLDRFRDSAVSVLLEKDPQFELPPEERYAASIYGKTPRHSRLLRNGLAESLALLGCHPRALTSCMVGKAGSTAALVVREILSDADAIQWASLNDLLPLLAEAAPGEFIDAFEKTLRADPCPFDELFAQEKTGVFGRNYMCGLLWAFETLAWDPDFFIRALISLGELAAIDPGGQWANRPDSSITAILLPWLPQTCAPFEKRILAAKMLLEDFPEIGWKSLLTLLPQFRSTSYETRRPAWRATIPDEWKVGVTREEYFEQALAFSELAIKEARKCVTRLFELVDHLEAMPGPAHDKLVEFLASDSVLTLPEEDKLCLWNGLEALVRKHRRFGDAEWAMTPIQVERIASVAERLAPVAPFYYYQPLFVDHDFMLFGETSDYKKQTLELGDRRKLAIQEVAADGGFQSVLAFSNVVESPNRVGFAFGAVAENEVDAMVLPALLDSDDDAYIQLAAGYVWGRFQDLSWKWVDGLDTSKWTKAQIGHFLSRLPFTQDTWGRSERLLDDDDSEYWTRTTANPYEAEGKLWSAIEKLLFYGRPNAAIRCVHKMLDDDHPIDTGFVAGILLEAAKITAELDSIDTFQIAEIIRNLQHNPDTEAADLFRVEWAFLPLLEYAGDVWPKFLEQRLADEPEFFCEMIRNVYRPEGASSSPDEICQEESAVANNAYRLFRNWRVTPGCRESGVYDGVAFANWLDSVKSKCRGTNHLSVAMTTLGQVLIHAPEDPDGLWIHRSPAAALNAPDAGNIRDGFRGALVNSRGAFWVDPTGKPEREFSEKYRAQAETIEGAGFHRLATTLRDLAGWYEREAERVSSEGLFDV